MDPTSQSKCVRGYHYANIISAQRVNLFFPVCACEVFEYGKISAKIFPCITSRA